jgi:hypothetical protein
MRLKLASVRFRRVAVGDRTPDKEAANFMAA